MRILVTGGAGFIGSNFVRYILKKHPDYFVVNYDKLTYAGHLSSLADVELNPNYKFVRGDIADRSRVDAVICKNKITHIVNFAAETHVDRSINDSESFITTNVLGTQSLLDAALKNKIERFHHVSTDEVFGELSLNSKEMFSENTTYAPKSPYSASKAASDHLVRAYHKTYGLNVTITNASNNFGPNSDTEKFIPRAITNLIDGKNIPIYGDGKYVRDWLYVEDHCTAIDRVLHFGKSGETYLVGGGNSDINNLEVAKKILALFGRGESFIEFVKDRPGHDRRYAIDYSKIKKELGWEPSKNFAERLRETVEWYRNNESWWRPIKEESERFYKDVKGAGDYVFAQSNIEKTEIPGLLVIKRPIFKDERGYFKEIVRNVHLTKERGGKEFEFRQWSHAVSLPGVIRGLHTENWNKIVYPVTGKMFSAFVDTRPESESFGKVVTMNFSPEDQKAIFIPKGVANSVCVNGKETVHYLYVVDDYYDSSDTTAIAWDDPDIGINWPVKNPIVSDRDKNNPRLRDLYPEKYKEVKTKKTLVIGADGLVGSKFIELHKNKDELLIPSYLDLDLTSKDSIKKYLDLYQPSMIINFAAYTNVSEAENQRGNKEGDCWRINVEGIKNLLEVMDEKTRLIHISTDMVFPGSKEDKGPYEINHKLPTNPNKLTWYGFTKAEGERLIREKLGDKTTILRIIYPFSAKYDKKMDYVRKPLDLFDQGKLYPMFSDQQVSVVFVEDVAMALEKLIETGKTGTFHASCRDTGSPFEIISYAVQKSRGVKSAVKQVSLAEFLKTQDSPVRYPMFGGLSVTKTEKALGIKFGTWKQMVDKFVAQLPRAL